MSGSLILSYVFFSIIEILVIISLHKKNELYIKKSVIFNYIIFSVILFTTKLIFAFMIPGYVLILSMISIAIHHYFGYLLDYYIKSRTFDRYLHAFGTFSFALLSYCLIWNIVWTGGARIYESIVVFTMGITVSSLFEIHEFLSDERKGTMHQKGLKDTNMDMVFNVIGSFFAGVFAFFFLL